MTIEANSRSRGVMDRLRMVRAPALDFDHPRVPEDSAMKQQIVYLIERQAYTSASAASRP